MKKTLSFCDFEKEFIDSNCYNDFGYEGLKALFNFLEEYEQESGEELELDVIALCCDYTKFDSAQEAYKEYNSDETVTEEEAFDWLQERTFVCLYEEGIIIQVF